MFVQEGIENFFEAISTRGLKKRGSSIFYLSGLEHAPCNGVFERELERDLSNEEIQDVTAKMDGLPFIWWSRCSRLEEQGFDFGGELMGIEMKIKGSFESSTIDMCQMQTDDEIKLYTDLTLEIFGMLPSVSERMAEINKCEQMVHFVAYVDGRPVGTVSLILGERIAGIWNLGMLNAYRQRGIGYQLVNEALRTAQKKGYDKVMAILMPKGMAAGLFERHGFHGVCKYPFYIYGSGIPLE